jgi:hypothetical protein
VSEAASFEFGRLRIVPQRREVLADDQPMETFGITMFFRRCRCGGEPLISKRQRHCSTICRN